MSKIICDICGTTYAETSKQCPICGNVRSGDVQRMTNEVKSDGNVSTGYTYVKGGRFSKSNVKKRTGSQAANTARKNVQASKGGNKEEDKNNRGLVITAIVLLLAIIGMVIYIALRVFGPYSDPTGDNTANTQGNNLLISCTDIILDTDTVLFEEVGVAKLLNVVVSPKNTTDKVVYLSENDAVVTVTENGKITAMGEGTAKIFITCGFVSKECTVTVKFPEETTIAIPEDTTQDATADTTVSQVTPPVDEEIRLNRKDITFGYKGESWVLYSGNIAKNLITWSSDDDSIVTFTEGKAVAVGSGMTEVHAEYDGQKVSCIIRCNFTDGSGVVGNGGVSEDGGGSASTAISGVIYNVTNGANVRKTPSLTGELAGTIAPGTKVTITEKKDADGYTWCKIGENRWVASNYIKTN